MTFSAACLGAKVTSLLASEAERVTSHGSPGTVRKMLQLKAFLIPVVAPF
jgi:hypothetical protein